MNMKSLYKEVMDLNLMDDNDQKRDTAKSFFERLNSVKLLEYFNDEGINLLCRFPHNY